MIGYIWSLWLAALLELDCFATYLWSTFGGKTMTDFTVKDSGKREEYKSGMRRDTNKGKIRYDLVVPETMREPMLKRWAEHAAKGADKYGDRNWEKAAGAEELRRFRESAIRHFMQWYMGEVDEDHASAVFFNIQGAEYCKEKMRPVTEEEKIIEWATRYQK